MFILLYADVVQTPKRSIELLERARKRNKTGSVNQQAERRAVLVKVDKFLLPNFFSIHSRQQAQQQINEERTKEWKRNLVYYTNQRRLFIHTLLSFLFVFIDFEWKLAWCRAESSHVWVCAHLTCLMAYRARMSCSGRMCVPECVCVRERVTNTTVKRKHTSNRV